MYFSFFRKIKYKIKRIIRKNRLKDKYFNNKDKYFIDYCNYLD